MTPTERRANHLRTTHLVLIGWTETDRIGDALCAGEDTGCAECSRLLDTWLSEDATSKHLHTPLAPPRTAS